MNIPKSCRRPVVSLLYATKSAFTAPNLCWACALASPVIFLTGDHVMQIGFGQNFAFGFVHKRSGNEIKNYVLLQDDEMSELEHTGTVSAFINK